MLTKEFIRGTFINTFERMTIGEDGLATNSYVGFALICQAIEILGACFDDFPWEKRDSSGSRFRKAITELFSYKYQAHNLGGTIDFYNNLRCPMLHQMRPGIYMGLSERRHEIKARESQRHLTFKDERLILIYEDFFSDFKNACEQVINMIEKHELASNKVYDHNISVPSDK